MKIVLLLVAFALVMYGLRILWPTKRRDNTHSRTSPPLPPRINAGAVPAVIRSTRTNYNNRPQRLPVTVTGATRSPSPPPLPSRTPKRTGPPGLRPEQFPCCPFDKQRNVQGSGQQLIFWDSRDNCYYCSRGHRFKMNGKIL